MQATAMRVLGAAAAAVDLAVRSTALARTGGKRNADLLRHEVRVALMHRLKDRYEKLGAYQSYFRDPRPLHPEQDVRLERRDGVRVIDVHWPSNYRTFLPEVQEQYERIQENHTATARLVVHPEPRPLVILIHGYLGGVHAMERRIWPMGFLERLGLDVALFVLPFHGRRMDRGLGGLPPFPGADPRITNEGFRQAMADFRDLFGWLSERGHPHIGVMGMSLGGYSTALAATLEDRLAFSVPMIPLASIADVAKLNGHLGSDPDDVEAQWRGLSAAHRMVSPLHRKAGIDSSRILIIASERDQITPIVHARKLAAHFRCRMETMPGGHLVQLGRNDKFRSFGRFLREIGVVGAESSAGGAVR